VYSKPAPKMTEADIIYILNKMRAGIFIQVSPFAILYAGQLAAKISKN